VATTDTSVDRLKKAMAALDELLGIMASAPERFHPAIGRHLKAAVGGLKAFVETDQQKHRSSLFMMANVQEARNHLLFVRELLGDEYHHIPSPDRVIRLCDELIRGVPGTGTPMETPH
jgi:hypothetical protein